MRLQRLYLDPQGGEGNGTATETATAGQQTQGASDPSEGLKKLLDKHSNDALAVASKLFDENYKLRQKNTALNGKLPAQGATVLTADEATAFDAFKALGKKPEELTQALYDLDEFRSAHARQETEKLHQSYAELHGYNATVLTKLLDDHDIEVEVRDLTGQDGRPVYRNGKTVQAAFVKEADPKDARKHVFTALPDYAKRNWPAFMPALAARDSTQPARPHGTPPPAVMVQPSNGAPPTRPSLFGGKNPF